MRRYLGTMMAAATVILYAAQPSAWAAPRGAAPAEPKFDEPYGADLNAGKTPAEVFRSDCGVCHKTPQGLAKDQRSLANFLRQHYTTGQPQAESMASYLASIRGGAPAAPVSPVRGGPDKPERPPAAIGSRRPAGEPADGPGHSEKKRAPAEQASRPAEPKPEAAARPDEAAKPESKPEPKPDAKPEAKPEAKPDAKPSPARRGPKIEEAAKPAAPDKPAAAAAPAPATRTAEPAPPPPPPPAAVQQPATPPPPQIPL